MLLPMANALLNCWLMSSNENVSGSPLSLVHVMVVVPPEVKSEGTLRVMVAEARGTRTRRVSAEIMLDS